MKYKLIFDTKNSNRLEKTCFMTNITTPVSAINVIQYKLDDYEDGKPKSMHPNPYKVL